MNLHEYQAKDFLRQSGVPIPAGEVAKTPEQVRAIAKQIGQPVVVKAQVLTGGRGKAGGVKLARNPAEAEQVAQQILGMNIRGHIVRKVLVTNAAEIAREIYLGAILDRETHSIVLMASAEGGVEIEVVARDTPEKILRRSINPYLGFADFQGREIGFALGLNLAQVRQFTKIAGALYRTLIENDATLLEINPLAVTSSGDLFGLDAKMVVDDNALFRHPKMEVLRDVEEEDPFERQAREEGISYVKLDGTIGCVVNGAGLAMATMDILKLYGGSPANFLDIGGGARAERVALALRLVLSDPKVRAVFFNIFGGITRCDEVARGIVEAIQQIGGTKSPIVVRLVGVNEAEGRQILHDAGLEAYTGLDEAAQAAVAAAQSTLPSGGRPIPSTGSNGGAA
ncbi:MAG TPA: ADP-forming succinate--CoA ligase subunit beta [Chloroflexota bacterium]|nr:ADP-forming succinate--CoA ligase subunit beta [Chloroflexota bacterium]